MRRAGRKGGRTTGVGFSWDDGGCFLRRGRRGGPGFLGKRSALLPRLEPLPEISAVGFGEGALAEPVLERLDRGDLDGEVVHRFGHGHRGAPERGRGGE